MNNYLTKKIAEAVAPIVQYSGISKMLKPIYGGLGHILMFHRVLPPSEKGRVHNHQSLEISTLQLESIIQFFVQNSYSAISLDDLYSGLLNDNLPNKFVVYTFDDGYSDNYHYAYPIFQKYDIPFAIYVATCFPDYHALLWWYGLEDLLLQNNSLQTNSYPFLREVNCRTLYQKEMAFNEIRGYLLGYNTKELLAFFNTFNINLESYVTNMALTWDEIVALSSDTLVTIGAHTLNHLALATLCDDECYFEIVNSKKNIESKINKDVHHFAYPFGKKEHAGLREFEMAKDIGFKTTTTTRLANIFRDHKDHMHALPRLSINSKTSSNVLKANINGVYPMIRNKFKKIVTE